MANPDAIASSVVETHSSTGIVASRSQPGRKLYACIYFVKTRNPAPVPNIPSSAIMITIASPEAVRPRLACTLGR